MEWLSTSSVMEKVLASLIAGAAVWALRLVYLAFFKRPAVQWAKVADIRLDVNDGENSAEFRLYGQRYFIRNNSAKRVEEVELWFEERPAKFVFDPNVRYREEESNGKYVVTIRRIEGKQSVFLDLQTDSFGLLERVVESGEEGSRLYDYRPVDPKAVVLPSLGDMVFILLFVLSLTGPFLVTFLIKLQNASGVTQ